MKEQQAKPYPVRLEPELYKWVREKAKAGDRSINAEITRIVRQAKEAESEGSKQGTTA